MWRFIWGNVCAMDIKGVKEVARRFAKSVAQQALENADKRVGAFPNYRNLVTDKITNPDNIPTI